MAGSIINIKIVGDGKDAKKAFDDVEKKAKGFDKSLGSIGVGQAAGFAALGVAAAKVSQFLVGATKAAIDDERAQAILAETLRDTIGATDDQVASVESFITATQNATGVLDDQLRPAFATLVRAMRDTESAQQSLNLALDISAGTGRDLESVSLALAKAYNGNVGGLQRLGISLKDAKGEALDWDAAQKQLNATFGGDAAAAADTAAGKIAILQAHFETLKEDLGSKLLPVLVEVTDGLIQLVDAADRLVNNLEGIGNRLDGFAGAFGDAGPDELTLALIKAHQEATRIVVPFERAAAAVDHMVTEFRLGHDGAAIFGLSLGQLTRVTESAGLAARRAANDFGSFSLLAARAAAQGVGQFTVLARDHQAQATKDYLESVASSIRSNSGSVSGAIRDTLAEQLEKVNDYLHALAQKQVDDLNDVYSSIGASISLDGAANAVDDAKQRLQSLVDEFNGLPGRIADAEGTVGSLLAAATAITPEEQQTIDQAQAEVDRIAKALQGVTEEVNAPASSFAGPSTISQTSKISFSLNDLKVAENKLAAAKAAAVGPTRELEQAEKDLADLRERYLEIPKQIESAQRSLISAEQSLVDAKRRQVEAGKELLEQGPDAIQQYKDLAAAAGLSADEVNRLVAGMIAAGNAAGLVDVFGNGYLFQPPDQADATRRFVAGLASFDTGGIVGGPKGAAQLVVAHGGETILPTHKGSVATLPPITINAGFGADAQAIANAVRKALLDVQRKNGSLGLN